LLGVFVRKEQIPAYIGYRVCGEEIGIVDTKRPGVVCRTTIAYIMPSYIVPEPLLYFSHRCSCCYGCGCKAGEPFYLAWNYRCILYPGLWVFMMYTTIVAVGGYIGATELRIPLRFDIFTF